MQGFTLLLAFDLAVRKAVHEHDRCLTYVTPKISKRTGRRVKRPKRSIEARLKLVSAFMEHTEAFKRFKQQVYLDYGRYKYEVPQQTRKTR